MMRKLVFNDQFVRLFGNDNPSVTGVILVGNTVVSKTSPRFIALTRTPCIPVTLSKLIGYLPIECLIAFIVGHRLKLMIDFLPF